MKQTSLIIICILATAAMLVAIFGFGEKTNTMLSINDDDYAKEWQEIDSLDKKRLPKSALEKVNALYLRAKKDNNPAQVVKTLFYREKYNATLADENGHINAIMGLTKEIATAESPVKEVLQSAVAQIYASYASDNYWKFQNRTDTGEFIPEDIRTWSLEKLHEETAKLYKASVSNEQLKKIRIQDFAAITGRDKKYATDELRPTLYDLLAFRALGFFSNERHYLTQPKNTFYLDQEEAFFPANKFSKYSFTSPDEQSQKYQTMLLFQDVIQFHLTDKNPVALIDADLMRLDFVKQNSTLSHKDSLYRKALEKMQNKYASIPSRTEIDFKLTQIHLNNAAQYSAENTQYKWEKKKALEICEKAMKDFPDSYGASLCGQLKAQILQKNFQLNMEKVIPSNTDTPVQINYTNVEQLWYKVIKLSQEQYKRFNDTNWDKRIDFLNKQAPVINKTFIQLPNDSDMNNHYSEIILSGLDYGMYFILASDNEQFTNKKGAIAYARTYITDLAYHHRENNGMREFIIINRKTGQPLQGVELDYYSKRYDSKKGKYVKEKRFTRKSDKDGFIKIEYIEDERNYAITLRQGKDFHDLDDDFYSNYYGRNNATASTVNHYFLDRSIYRPGQTIYYKMLPLNFSAEDRKPSILPNTNLEVIFKDANWQEIKRVKLTTNEYGTVSGTFQAPNSGMLGTFSISTEIDAKDIGYHTFRVEEYKRPKFEAKFEPVKTAYKLNDKVTVEGKATAFAGSNIDGAAVSYRVVRNISYPYWRYWWRPMPNSQGQEIAFGKTTTDEEGKFSVDFEAVPDKSTDPKNKPQFSYTVYADITDITGETRSTQTNVTVGYIALAINIDVPYEMERSALEKFTINSKNLNGQFEAAKGNITIHQLLSPEATISKYWGSPDSHILSKEDYKKQLPKYPYKDEHMAQNWLVGNKVVDAGFDTKENKEFSLDKKSFSQGKYKLVLTTKDKFGEDIKVEKLFDVFDGNQKKAVKHDPFFQNIPKVKYEPGEKLNFYVSSPFKDARMLYEIEHQGKVIKREWKKIEGMQKISIPIEEKHRGGFTIHLRHVHSNRQYSTTWFVAVPWTNKELKIEYATFRNKLYPGQEEEWQLKISGAKGDRATAEMLASMYDASLDAFSSHRWYLNPYPMYNTQLRSRTNHFGSNSTRLYQNNWQPEYNNDIQNRYYRSLSWFGFPVREYDLNRFKSYGNGRKSTIRKSEASAMAAPPPPPAASAPTMEMDGVAELEMAEDDSNFMDLDVDVNYDQAVEKKKDGKKGDFSGVKVRTNLKETVFFFPNLATDKDGNVIIKFTMNEALTKWKFMALAHTKDLAFAQSTKEVVTQKDLMVMPNAPRFVREGDRISFTAKVSNLTKETMNGTAVLQLFDAVTNEAVDIQLGNEKNEIPFTAKAGQSAPLSWTLNIPKGKVNAITHRVIAKAGTFSDGEEDALPVLTNRMLVTESLPLPVRGGETKDFSFTKLKNSGGSSTLQHHKMSLEFTSNPAWYAVQSLPYLMEYPYDCTEQIFSRYYANALATSVANSQPNIKKVFEKWKNTEALESNLSKNQELKYAILEDTPWVMDAQNEAQQKKNIGLLFDLNRMASEQEKAIAKITERQMPGGGFSWFPGGRDSWYITQYLVEGLGHLDRLGVKDIRQDAGIAKMVKNAVQYCDQKLLKEYNELAKRVKKGKAKWEDDHLSRMVIHYLYARSFFDYIKSNSNTDKAVAYYTKQAKKYWTNKNQYSQGMIALALDRKGGHGDTTGDIVKSLEERSLNNEEMGKYWKYNTGYYWYQLPIETHALMIEVFDEVAKDEKAVDDLKVWLLKNKQTNNWKTTKGTAAAVYALLMRGDNWLAEDKDVNISLGGKAVDVANIEKEPGTGYFKIDYAGEDVKPSMAEVKVENTNKVVAWGAVYWQYFEDLDKITTFEETPLTLKKQLFLEENTDNGPKITPIDGQKLQPGDKLKVRIELRVDRDMEYVHMKDMRASGLEPINVLSQYKWQGGLGYYESTKDASTNFFFDHLPKGTWVFEYPLRVQHKGEFSNGITTIQCMYAPEFTSHSEGVRITVE